MIAKRCKFLLLVGASTMWILPLRTTAQDDFQKPNPSPASVQKVLDLLAAPLPADSTLPKMPSQFSAWTADQRKTFPRQIEGRCGALWTMMNAGGNLHLLPSEQDPADTPKLALNLCLAGKMPQDWPARQTLIAEISRILRRSGGLGEPLSMPAVLLP
jgi:hypothetical protein